MIAVIDMKFGNPCIAYWTGRQGLSVKAHTWCGKNVSVSDGLLQVPDNAAVCSECAEAVASGTPVNV